MDGSQRGDPPADPEGRALTREEAVGVSREVSQHPAASHTVAACERLRCALTGPHSRQGGPSPSRQEVIDNNQSGRLEIVYRHSKGPQLCHRLQVYTKIHIHIHSHIPSN